MLLCIKCKLLKQENLFYTSLQAKSGYRSKCKECELQSVKKYQQENREATLISKRNSYHKRKEDDRATQQQFRTENREHCNSQAMKYYYKKKQFIIDKKIDPCYDCKMIFPSYCMDFDHRENEVKCFTIANCTTFSMKKLEEEIAKCDVVCANCHRKRTHHRRAKKD